MKKEEIKKILEKVTEENDLSRQEKEALENLTDINGGMSQRMQKALIGIGIALSGTALGAAALYGGKRFNKWYKERNEKSGDTNINASKLVSSTPSQPQAVAVGLDSPSPSAQPLPPEIIRQIQEASKIIPLD